jgi:hypothetical protein
VTQATIEKAKRKDAAIRKRLLKSVPPGPICGNCKWWKVEEMDAELRSDCELTLMSYGKSVHPSSKAVGWDGEGFAAGLSTLADFGCNQFETREAA